MSLDPRIQQLMDARNLLSDVLLEDGAPDSDAGKAIRAAILSTEIAWRQIEEMETIYPTDQ